MESKSNQRELCDLACYVYDTANKKGVNKKPLTNAVASSITDFVTLFTGTTVTPRSIHTLTSNLTIVGIIITFVHVWKINWCENGDGTTRSTAAWIGHFRLTLCLSFETSLCTKLFICYQVWLAFQNVLTFLAKLFFYLLGLRTF